MTQTERGVSDGMKETTKSLNKLQTEPYTV